VGWFLGTIDSDELGSVMRSMGLQPSDDDVMDMINEVCVKLRSG
jgi:Ca2+-binding EF-hand superfamily protein